MLKEYAMIGSTKEDLEMNKIIKENQIKTRKLNEQKSKKNKFERRLVRFVNVMVYVWGLIGFAALMILISIIENLKF